MDHKDLQEFQYIFPYHHIPSLTPFSSFRVLPWAHEYAAYTEAILDELAKRPFASLIDVGCGDGKLLAEASRRFKARLLGTDFSEQALRFARAFAPTAEFRTDYPSGEQFEAFTLIEVLEHIPPEEVPSFFKELSGHLAPGAFGIITIPSVVDPLFPKHYRHFTKELLTEVLAPHFEIESIRHMTARTLGPAIIRRLLSNQLFVLNFEPLRAFLYSFYKKHYLWSDVKHGARLMAIVRKAS